MNLSESKFFSGSSLGSDFINPIVWGVILKPLDDSISISFTIEINWRLSFISSPELQSWESLYVDACNLIFSWIEFGNYDVGVVDNSGGSFVVVGSQSLAMSAPWGVELY